jgi:hypothetical protein
VIPLGQALPKFMGEDIHILLHARAHQNVVLPLPSQQPSDGLFNPMEVRTNHMHMCTDPLVPIRRVWSCTSKTTPSMGSSVLGIIAMSIISSLNLSNTCMKFLAYHLRAQRHYTDLLYTAEETDRTTYWDNTHKRWKVSSEYYSNHVL